MSNETKKQFSLEEWRNTMPENFDLTAEYAERVHPIIEQLIKTCQELHMPVFVTVSNKQDEQGSYVGGYQHFASAARAPASMLLAMHASKLQYSEMVNVSRADEERGKAFFAANGGIGGIMANVTKH